MSELNDFGTSVGNYSSKKMSSDCGAPCTSEDCKPSPTTYSSANNQYTVVSTNVFSPVGTTINILEPGMYDITAPNGRIFFNKRIIQIDELIQFPDSKSDRILKEIESFWQKGSIFKEYGFLHRRGYLFYGPAGSGKTSLVQLIIADIITKGGVIFICDSPSTLTLGLVAFREVEPDREVVCLFEDIEAIISSRGESEILSLLDGENQINKVLNIATTNYPERLDKRIVSRPRRFDRVIKIGMPTKSMRIQYFARKLNIANDELEKWADATENFSFAAMAELVISVKCLGNDFDTSLNRLKDMMAKDTPSSIEYDEDRSRSTGFGWAQKEAESDHTL